jgi:Flp pilus assembly protein CpaB
MFRSLRRRLARIGRWPRLCAAGLCLLLALASSLGARRGTEPAARSVGVVVAARELPAGHRLNRSDLDVVRWPAALRPSGTGSDGARYIGQRLAGPMGALEPITSHRLVGPDLGSGLAAGLVAATAPLDDPHTGDLVRPGDRVDVLATPRPSDLGTAPAGEPRIDTTAENVLVLAVLPPTDPSAAGATDAEVVLAVDRATAVQLTRDKSRELFTLVLDPP